MNYIEYMLFDSRRKQKLHQKLLLESRVSQIQQAIYNGINVAVDPGYSEDFFKLIGEYGEGIFNLEGSNVTLTKEEEKV